MILLRHTDREELLYAILLLRVITRYCCWRYPLPHYYTAIAATLYVIIGLL